MRAPISLIGHCNCSFAVASRCVAFVTGFSQLNLDDPRRKRERNFELWKCACTPPPPPPPLVCSLDWLWLVLPDIIWGYTLQWEGKERRKRSLENLLRGWEREREWEIVVADTYYFDDDEMAANRKQKRTTNCQGQNCFWTSSSSQHTLPGLRQRQPWFMWSHFLVTFAV